MYIIHNTSTYSIASCLHARVIHFVKVLHVKFFQTPPNLSKFCAMQYFMLMCIHVRFVLRNQLLLTGIKIIECSIVATVYGSLVFSVYKYAA